MAKGNITFGHYKLKTMLQILNILEGVIQLWKNLILYINILI